MTQDGTTNGPAPTQLKIETSTPTLVIATSDPASTEVRINVDAPHASSRAALDASTDEISVTVQGPARPGKAGQARACKTFVSRLKNDGYTAKIRPATKHEDERGIDAHLEIEGQPNRIVQIVTAPGVPELWHGAQRGSATLCCAVSGAVEWLRVAIVNKGNHAAPPDRTQTVLLIDAQHAGVLATPGVRDAYIRSFGDPVAEFGFASVWVVGPTVPYSSRLGTGEP